MHIFKINTLIQFFFFKFWRLVHVSNLICSSSGRQLHTQFLYGMCTWTWRWTHSCCPEDGHILAIPEDGHNLTALKMATFLPSLKMATSLPPWRWPHSCHPWRWSQAYRPEDGHILAIPEDGHKLTALKIATWVAETCWWLLYNKFTLIHSSAFLDDIFPLYISQ
jgi:hypothetical protein